MRKPYCLSPVQGLAIDRTNASFLPIEPNWLLCVNDHLCGGRRYDACYTGVDVIIIKHFRLTCGIELSHWYLLPIHWLRKLVHRISRALAKRDHALYSGK